MSTDEREARARSRAEAKYGFYKHLATYVVVNLALFVINLTTSPAHVWAIWPLIGWGIGVAAHALQVFVPRRGNPIVERLTEKELREDEAERG